MKKIVQTLFSKKAVMVVTLMSGCIFTMTACSEDEPTKDNDNKGDTPVATQPKWHLEWSDDFNGTEIDESVWSRTDRGTPDWANTQSKDDACYEMRNGCLVLKGIVNPDLTTDPSAYLTGGVWTKGKKGFGPDGSIKIRARLPRGAQGAWPALWLMPFDNNSGWPTCGEIDIMERLNFENQVYQTVHSHYTYDLGKKDPTPSRATYVDPSDWHDYEVQIWQGYVKFFIDGVETLSYPKVNYGADNQFPFYQKWFIIMDMQLGGSWVGNVNASQLPVEMEIDWVKYYRYY